MEILTRTALAALLLGTAGCDLRRDPLPLALAGERVVVHSVLRAGADSVAVVVRRVRPARGDDDPGTSLPVSGATVRLRRGAEEVSLAEAAGVCAGAGEDEGEGSAGCYAAVLPGGVRAGEPHGLRITLPGGGQVTGTAVPPAPPRLLRPASGERFPVPGGAEPAGPFPAIPVRWAAEAGTAGIALTLRPLAAFLADRRVEGARCHVDSFSGRYLPGTVHEVGAADTLSLVVNAVGCAAPSGQQPLRPDSLRAELVVAAYDTAYTRYARLFLRESAPVEAASAGLSGALGVFGGAAVARRQVTLVLAPAGAGAAVRRERRH